MIVVITGRHRYHELWALGFSVFVGTGYLVRVPAPASLAAAMPRWVVILWAAGLVVSGVVGLLGCLWLGDMAVGLGLERGAMLLSTAALILLASSILSAFGWNAAWGAGITTGWALANAARFVQISKDLRQITAATEERADE